MTKTFSKLLLLSALSMIACQKKGSQLEIQITKQKAGYGYQIIKGKKTLIDQPFIPAIQGEQAFKDSIQARKTAELVIHKIGNSSFPRISLDELDSMKIAYEIQKFQ
jgi:hypothetical protein